MLFHEIYGNYYHTVARILTMALNEELDKKELYRIVQEEAFGESLMTIPDALIGGKWGLLTLELETTITKEPSMPLTILEKRWLKSLLLDPRIQLFNPDMTGLEDVEPLFQQDWLVYYDQYNDGDPFTDSKYIQNFQCILTALKTNKQLDIHFTDGKGNSHHVFVSPRYLEYSKKNDRFRLIGEAYRFIMINLSRINQCQITDQDARYSKDYTDQNAVVTLRLTDKNNALERFLLNFSHLKKITKKLDDIHYQITLYYDKRDETEILIRILSFGIWVEVVEPEDIRDQLRKRIEKQMVLMNN